MTSADLTTAGRPYGGVRCVCKQKSGFTYDEIKCDSDRLMGLDVSYNGCKVLKVYGVYMPYNNHVQVTARGPGPARDPILSGPRDVPKL